MSEWISKNPKREGRAMTSRGCLDFDPYEVWVEAKDVTLSVSNLIAGKLISVGGFGRLV